jgi:TRAP-type C4-dicarboxylate transport system permease small subunit
VTRWLVRAERAQDALAVVLFALMFGVIVLQVVLRYVFNAPLVFTDELAAYLFVWVSFFGWTLATRKRIHIGIGVIAERLPAKLRRTLHALWCAASVAFAAVLFVVGAMIVHRNGDVRMVSLDFAVWPVYVVVPIAALFLVAYGIRDLLVIVRRGDVKATEAQL